MSSYERCGNKMKVQKVLKEFFGFDSFRPGQEEVIRDVLNGRSQIAILPTGSGKSLCFQLPAQLMDGTVLIISPLVALMEDQVATLKQQGEKRVAALNSFHTYQERERIIRNLHQYKFIFISPEMLTAPKIAHAIRQTKLAFIVVDEAHCISQWGFDFRPDYLRISEFLKAFPHTSVLALTATADQKVIEDITKYLNLEVPALHIYSLDRPNLSYAIQAVNSEEEKTNWLTQRLKKSTGPGIIYVSSRKRADELAYLLRDEGERVTSYHAGMEQEDRAFVQAQFLNGDVEWICATSAFGMGIHKDDVRQVIHEHVPATIANYVQEIGRAGRDGNLSTTTLIYTSEDIRKTRFIIHEDLPKDDEIRLFGQLLKEGKSIDEATQLAGISETAKRMLNYYVERMSIDEIIVQIHRQRTEKENELMKMGQLLESTACIRAQILHSFGEKLEKKPEFCCGNCQSIDIEMLNLMRCEQSKRRWIGWDKRLTQLLG